MSRQILRGTLVLPDRLLEGGRLVIEDGVIAAVEATAAHSAPEPGHCLIAPGFIDLLHVHGIAGADTMAAPKGSLAVMARALAGHGVTGFLPTTVTAGLDHLAAVIGAVHGVVAANDFANQ